MDDDKLLAHYARDGSEAAFGQLVARHLSLVYATCLRETGSSSQAEDAAQVVFLLLARKAKSLRAGPSLAGWLYNAARFVAKDVRKQEARRRLREQSVIQEMTHRQESPAPEWEHVEPLLNDALSALKPAEREAVLLRFLEGRSLAETGAALGLSEDAARMRVSRAVEKMRHYLTAHGLTTHGLTTHGAAVTGAVLTGLLTSEAARPAPFHAATTIAQGTLQSLSGGPTANVLLLSKGVYQTMKIIKVKFAALAAAVLLAAAALPPLARALSLHKTSIQVEAQVPPVPQSQQQAFQIGMTLRECSLRAQAYANEIASIRTFPDKTLADVVSINAETTFMSRQTPEIRGLQSSQYGQVYVILRQMQAPAEVCDWYHQEASRLASPLASTSEVRAQAQSIFASSPAYSDAMQARQVRPATEPELTTDLAGMNEITAAQAIAATQQAKVEGWLKQVGPEAAWSAALGSFAETLHDKSSYPGRYPSTDFTEEADRLLQTVPQDAPAHVRQDLTRLVTLMSSPQPNSPPGTVTILPRQTLAQQMSRVYDDLWNTYNAKRTRKH